jgi:Xaa-Pro aminopeptidase
MTQALERLTRYIQQRGLDAALINSSEHLASPNLKYVTGFRGSDACAVITPTERHLITDGRYKLQAAQEAPDFKLHVTRDKTAVLARLLITRKLFRLAIEPARVTHELITNLTRKAPELVLRPLNKKFLDHFRIRKTPAEIELVKKAAEIASEACRRVVEEGLAGRTELEIAGKLELLFRSLGADCPSFPTIVASGARSALPHAVPTPKEILPGDLTILDFGCSLSGYSSDETVTCVAAASPTPLQKRMYEVVREAQLRAIDSLRVGVPVGAVDEVARKCIADAGFGKHFVHGLGHGVGLEVHEPPWLTPKGKEVLEEGMIMTIEPGIYIEGVGGVRLESLIAMRTDGPVILSQMPKDLILVN